MTVNRITFAGTMPGGEVWSTRVHFGQVADPNEAAAITPADCHDWALQIRDGLSTTLAQLKTCMSGGVFLTSTTVEAVNNDGTLVGAGTPAMGSMGGAGTVECPLQTSVVISSLTGLPGASRRGRNYWPGVGIFVNANGRLATPTAPADIAADWLSLMQLIAGTTPTVEVQPVVLSTTLLEATPVASFSVGDVPDVQNRRRDRLAENYSSVAWVP